LSSIFLANFVVNANIEDAKKVVNDLVYKKSIHARMISYTFSDKDQAIRYVKNAEFYGYGRKSKTNKCFGYEHMIDFAVYPIVDTVVGHGMNKLTAVACIYGATKGIVPSNIKFLSNNAHLITSAAITNLISIEAGKGISKINSNDIKDFGKSCAAQVGCDAIDEFVVKPVVKMMVGDETSWTACALRGVGNYMLAQYVMDKVSKP